MEIFLLLKTIAIIHQVITVEPLFYVVNVFFNIQSKFFSIILVFITINNIIILHINYIKEKLQ